MDVGELMDVAEVGEVGEVGEVLLVGEEGDDGLKEWRRREWMS